MGEDHHIYIHSEEKSTLASNTQPKEDTLGGAFKPTQKAEDKELQELLNGGASSLTKINAGVGVAIGAAVTIDKVLTTGFGHLADFTGQYQYAMGINNFNTTIKHIVNPIGYVKQVIHREAEWNKINQSRELQSQLLGATIYDKKVGI